MAMADELQSFLFMFQTLCRSGRDATLTVDAHVGEASVHLKVGLCKASNKFNPSTPRQNRNGPSRKQRRVRREEPHHAAEVGDAHRKDNGIVEEAVPALEIDVSAEKPLESVFNQFCSLQYTGKSY